MASNVSEAESYFEYTYARYVRRRRMYVALGVLLIAVGGVSYFISSQFRYFSLPVLLAEVAGFLLGLAILLMGYLRGGIRLPVMSPSGRVTDDAMTERLEYEISRLKSDLMALKADKPSSVGQHADVIGNLRTTIAAEIVADVQQRLSQEALSKAQTEDLRRTFASSYSRLLEALSQLNRRGNLNLVIGVVTTVLAAGLLAYMVLQTPPFKTSAEILAHYIPRLSTIIFIEVFSFFFLRLYKATLADSKFYQVELIGLATTDIALQAAMRSSDAAAMTSFISQLLGGRRGSDSTTDGRSSNVDVKGFADVLEKFAKLAVEASKAKT